MHNIIQFRNSYIPEFQNIKYNMYGNQISAMNLGEIICNKFCAAAASFQQMFMELWKWIQFDKKEHGWRR
jgi:hypothetical protein